MNTSEKNTLPNTSRVLLVIVCSYMMIVLDISLVIAALPRMQLDLGFTATGLSWVQNACILAFGGLLLLGARAGDILGRRRMFITGLMLFTLASLTIGLAQSAGMLILYRAIQGVGAAFLAPSNLALLAGQAVPMSSLSARHAGGGPFPPRSSRSCPKQICPAKPWSRS
jgi:MFS family permease